MRLEVAAVVHHWWLALRLSRRGKLPVGYRAVAVLARRVRVEFEQHQSVHMVEHVTRVLHPTHPYHDVPPPHALCPPQINHHFTIISSEKWLRGNWNAVVWQRTSRKIPNGGVSSRKYSARRVTLLLFFLRPPLSFVYFSFFLKRKDVVSHSDTFHT